MTRTVQRKIGLHRAQALFRHSQALYRGFCGGRGAGKSWAGAYDLLMRAKAGHTYMVVSPTYVVLDDTTLPTFRQLAKSLGMFKRERTTPRPSMTLFNDATIRFRSAEEPEKLRGPNLSGVWLDEASLMVEEAFKICIASLREHGEQGWLSATFTPKGYSHWTYERFGTGREHTESFHSATSENPFNPAQFAQILLDTYGEGAVSDQELRGLFVEEDESFQVCPATWIRAAMARWTPGGRQGHPLDAMGVDVARGGADRTVLARRYGKWFAPLLQWPGKATPDGPIVAKQIMDAITQGEGANPHALVAIDILNCGTSVYDCCHLAKVARPWAVNFGESTPATDSTGLIRFANMRAYAYWAMRELLDPSRGFNIALPPDPKNVLLGELSAAKWKSQGSGVVALERKEEIAKRLGRSPDLADALVLSILVPAFDVEAAPLTNLAV